MTLSQIMQGLHESKTDEAQKQARTAMMIWILGLPDSIQARDAAEVFLSKPNQPSASSAAAKEFIVLLKDVAKGPKMTHPARRKQRVH